MFNINSKMARTIIWDNVIMYCSTHKTAIYNNWDSGVIALKKIIHTMHVYMRQND